ncbi:MAG: HEAT repeat domain-containing protein, partial [Planctomycetes bacterium]|nr:HEAT repeat domain-containing protein [Planctomycetota bacterium]
ELEAIREVAFHGAARFLDDDELVETMRRETNPKIRRAALATLDERGSKQTAEMARWLFERVDFPGPDRANAARILTKLEGPRVLGDFLKAAKKNDAVTPGDLKKTMAELLVQMNDEKVNKALAKQIGKGKRDQKVFALEATMHLTDDKLLKQIRKGLKDRDVEVRRATAMALAERKDEGSLEDLEKMLDRPKVPEDFEIAVEAITKIKGANADWLKRLATMVDHEDREVRNAALRAVGGTRDANWLGIVQSAMEHDDWSTRLIAYEALQRMRDKSSIPKLIERLGVEKGRMATAVADTLWSLTAMPFDEELARWQTWWNGEGAKFEVVSLSDLAKAKKEREMKRLLARTRSENQFFGIRVESNRVIFIIDTSGSMLETMHGRYIGKRQATRIDIAKQELSRCIKELEPGSLFNVMSFSSGIGFWMKEGIASSSEATREQALEFVERLGAQGATNLFDPIKIAFDDPDVDTIFILSDGEPTAGEILDPFRIREQVRKWNEHRNIKIHTIAIGGNLEVLEWLAEDSGGNHVRMR